MRVTSSQSRQGAFTPVSLPGIVRFLHTPEGGGDGTGGGGGSTNASNSGKENGDDSAGAGGDDADSSSAKNKGDADPNANPNGEPNTDGKKKEGEGDEGKDEQEETFTLTQAQMTKRINDALARQKAQLERAAQKEKDQKEAQALEQQGNYKALYEKATKDLKDRDDKILELEGVIAENTKKTLVATIAAKYKVPSELHEFLHGETEEELEANAKKLGKHITIKAPQTEGGGTRPGTNGTARNPNNTGERSYAFEKQGDVAITPVAPIEK